MIGVKDERWGERPQALIVLRAGGCARSADEVRAYLLGHVDSKRISRYAVPEVERVVFVSDIPKTSVGKIDKKLLRQRFE